VTFSPFWFFATSRPNRPPTTTPSASSPAATFEKIDKVSPSESVRLFCEVTEIAASSGFNSNSWYDVTTTGVKSVTVSLVPIVEEATWQNTSSTLVLVPRPTFAGGQDRLRSSLN